MVVARCRPARAWVRVLAAGPLLWAAAVAASVPLANDPMPQRWDRQSAAALLAYIERIDGQGLEPADYQPAGLRRAIQLGDSAELERQATESFGLVARDLANGHVRPAQRTRFYIATEPLQPARVAVLIDRAIASRDMAGVLDGLAPGDPQYAALRRALASLPAGADAERRKVEASLERWRWMPRQMGSSRLLVNIPEYRLHVSAEGAEVATHRVIVGKTSTPTPQFSANVTGVILNPTWSVPQSIIAESVGRLVRNSPGVARARGYTWSSSGGRLRVTQQPGPQNALGQLKLDMPNGFTVYLHDTPSKQLFDEEVRTLSHGCIRTDQPFDLAVRLLDGTGWPRSRIDQVVATRKTTRVALEQAMPIYIVYMTAYVQPDGTVGYFGDPYGLDGGINRLLDDGRQG